MGRSEFLGDLYRRGKPIADVVIRLTPGCDPDEIVDLLNAIAPDLRAQRELTHRFVANNEAQDPLLIELNATSEALARVFGWVLVRKHLPRWIPERGVYEGTWPNSFYWDDSSPVMRYPDGLDGKVVSIGLSQPGGADAGGPDEPTYELPNQAV